MSLRSLALCALCALGSAQADPAGYFQSQVRNFWRGISDPSTNARVQQIWLDLVDYSHVMRPVIPAQQFNAGQALPNGAVLLDISIAGDPDPNVTAFWLAHEYGHQVLGHPQLGATPWGQFLAMRAGTANEDAADRWAARFMRAKDYDVEPAVEFLCNVPSAPGDTHSTGPQRARNVARTFGASLERPCGSRSDSGDVRRPVPSRPASACVTPTFYCPMAVPVPIGSGCFCASPLGPVPGVAR